MHCPHSVSTWGVHSATRAPRESGEGPCRPSCSYSSRFCPCVFFTPSGAGISFSANFLFQVKAVEREENMTESKQGNDPRVQGYGRRLLCGGSGQGPQAGRLAAWTGLGPGAQHGPGLSLPRPQEPGSMGGRPSESSLGGSPDAQRMSLFPGYFHVTKTTMHSEVRGRGGCCGRTLLPAQRPSKAAPQTGDAWPHQERDANLITGGGLGDVKEPGFPSGPQTPVLSQPWPLSCTTGHSAGVAKQAGIGSSLGERPSGQWDRKYSLSRELGGWEPRGSVRAPGAWPTRAEDTGRRLWPFPSQRCWLLMWEGEGRDSDS